ncbi:small RNA-binding protein 11, chloroplastic [Elaeis guineensis]|uniref:Organelle RRM domain-containing protein 2, mitochondrial n=1 Tax=Elaeis guineensis var. tenera TaxID=51953 RepID=A0A6I9R580_ELAGV|nr:organelle RRM domain-containing protein 2, mitochondrial [Elaeis guineensis]
MALSSSLGLRRLLLRASPSSLPQWKRSFSPVRQSSSFPSDDDAAGGNLPPLTTPKLFVSGLSRLTTDEKLREAFSPYGQLLEAKVITDRVSGRSKGFAFVRYATIEEADKARHGMNAKFLDGWVIFVDPAKPREPKPPRPAAPEPSETGIRTNKTIGWCG